MQGPPPGDTRAAATMTKIIIAPFHGPHDHDNCLDEALRMAEETCARRGLRLTELRKQVL